MAARALGAQVWGTDGRSYIDFVGGIGVLNVGHNHPRVVQAVRAQLERLTHTSIQVAVYEPYVRLAQRLNTLVPVGGPAKTLLLTTGAEAVENAVKIARAATGRPAIIAFGLGFHGRTLLGITLTGKVKPYRQSFGPFAPEVYHAPYPYAYRGWTSERALAAFEYLLATEVDASRVAAVIVEPVLGEGGFVPAPPEFLRALRRLTRQHGVLLIADEIQSGFGRTGTLFAVEHACVEPDLITMAKSMAGGLPLAAVSGRADVMDAPEPGGLGGTYAGNPLACAAALAVLDIIESQELLARSVRLGRRLEAFFRDLAERHACIGDVRALGAMVGVELVQDSETREPAPQLAHRVVAEARDRGLMLLTAGSVGQVIRVLVPLIIDDALLERGLAIFEAALEAATVPAPAPLPNGSAVDGSVAM